MLLGVKLWHPGSNPGGGSVATALRVAIGRLGRHWPIYALSAAGGALLLVAGVAEPIPRAAIDGGTVRSHHTMTPSWGGFASTLLMAQTAERLRRQCPPWLWPTASAALAGALIPLVVLSIVSALHGLERLLACVVRCLPRRLRQRVLLARLPVPSREQLRVRLRMRVLANVVLVGVVLVLVAVSVVRVPAFLLADGRPVFDLKDLSTPLHAGYFTAAPQRSAAVLIGCLWGKVAAEAAALGSGAGASSAWQFGDSLRSVLAWSILVLLAVVDPHVLSVSLAGSSATATAITFMVRRVLFCAILGYILHRWLAEPSVERRLERLAGPLLRSLCLSADRGHAAAALWVAPLAGLAALGTVSDKLAGRAAHSISLGDQRRGAELALPLGLAGGGQLLATGVVASTAALLLAWASSGLVARLEALFGSIADAAAGVVRSEDVHPLWIVRSGQAGFPRATVRQEDATAAAAPEGAVLVGHAGSLGAAGQEAEADAGSGSGGVSAMLTAADASFFRGRADVSAGQQEALFGMMVLPAAAGTGRLGLLRRRTVGSGSSSATPGGHWVGADEVVRMGAGGVGGGRHAMQRLAGRSRGKRGADGEDSSGSEEEYDGDEDDEEEDEEEEDEEEEDDEEEDEEEEDEEAGEGGAEIDSEAEGDSSSGDGDESGSASEGEVGMAALAPGEMAPSRADAVAVRIQGLVGELTTAERLAECVAITEEWAMFTGASRKAAKQVLDAIVDHRVSDEVA